MTSKQSLKVKICCISTIDEALTAINAGADILGLVGHMPSGPGIITDRLAAEIADQVPKHIETFLLTSETAAAEIVAHHRRVNNTALQIVDALSEGTYQQIRSALPGIKLVQVIHVLDDASLLEAHQVSEFVDALLLDSGNPNLAVKELGGTGRTHNWHISQQIVDKVDIPVYLAGGLKVNNVAQAIKQVKPYGIDLCSGVRSGDCLDTNKLSAFMRETKTSGD